MCVRVQLGSTDRSYSLEENSKASGISNRKTDPAHAVAFAAVAGRQQSSTRVLGNPYEWNEQIDIGVIE